MQYYLRFHFSCIVVMSHLWTDAFYSSGSYAVCGFFVISGYVITMVLQERYFQIENGFRNFWINRFLRLYPTFLIVTIVGFLVALWLPQEANDLRIGLVLPDSAFGEEYLTRSGYDTSSTWWHYVINVLGIGHQAPLFWTAPIAFAPTIGTVNIELYYYFVLSLGVATSVRLAWRNLRVGLALLACIIFFALLHGVGVIPYGRFAPGIEIDTYLIFYKTFFGWTFFFAIGSLCWFLPKLELQGYQKYGLLAACLFFPFVYSGSENVIILLRIAYGVIVALTIRSFSDDRGAPLVRLLGDLSYPLFLIHWPMAAIASWILVQPKNSFSMLALTLTLSILGSLVIVLVAERPIEKIRRKVAL